MYRVQMAPAATEAFLDLHPEIRRQLKSGLKKLAENPQAGKMLQDELADFWTYKIKRYRIIYKFDGNSKFLKVYMIGHRREIYDLFSRFVKNSR